MPHGTKTSDSNAIGTLLDEPNTVFLVFTGTDNALIQPLFDQSLQVIDQWNSEVWRVLWVEHPEQLDDALTTLFWPNGVKHAIVLSLGTGLNREVKASYDPGDLDGATDLFGAFSNG